MSHIGIIGAVLRLLILSAHATAEFHNGVYQRHQDEALLDFASGPLARPASLSFHYRRDDLPVSPWGANSSYGDNSTLAIALRTVRGAQAEMRELRARLMAAPRRSDFRPAPDAQGRFAAGGQRIQPNGTLVSTDPSSDATGINGTVASAAKLVAEAVARNSSLASYLQPQNGSATTEGTNTKRAGGYWMEGMTQNGVAPYAGAGYKVWRNVKDYGAKGDGVTDDTAAINRAVTDGNRCGAECGSTTATPAVVYFPAGTYLVSGTLLAYYYTQMIGDATNPPILKAAASFSGFGVVSSNAYVQGDVTWYINQGNFYRQVRNFIIDIRDAPLHDQVCGLHWQVGQGTSLENIQFIMSDEAGNNQMGIFMENGSGGFMSDLTFTGGAQGALFGNQQFTARNLKFSNHQKQAMQLLWDWGWTWKGITIENCPVGVYMYTGTDGPEEAALFVDSVFSNVNIGLKLEASLNGGAASLNLFNVVANNVPVMVAYDNGQTLLGGVSGTIVAWGLGKRYDSTDGEDSGVWQAGQYYARTPVISSGLMGGSGIFARSKPQYAELGAGDFVNVKSTYGAKGDGASDDTAALNQAFQASATSGQVAWLPYGVYVVADTVTIPKGAKIVGQLWSNIMASGVKFSDASKPYPVVKVGNVGDIGTVEIQDVMFTVRGATAGAKLVEWNIQESSQGAAAMWDSHIRVGGAVGSNLQVADCPKLSGGVKANCVAASMLMHITSKASGYFENNWLWTADHDLETSPGTQIDVFAGRGLLIEGPGPVWLWGTAVEHCVLYQYQLAEASNVFMGMIQTESPYFQPTPNAPQPFTDTGLFPHDPAWGYCDPSSPSCAVSWALRIINSAHVYIYGAGLYSWFQSYDAACIDEHVCQDRIAEIATSSDIWVYNLATKDSVEMISPDGGTSVLGADNHYNYLDVIMAWLGGAGGGPIGGPGGPGGGSGNGTTGGGGGGAGSGGGGVGGGATYNSPTNATVIPFPKTTVKPTNTFTIAGPVVSDIDLTPNDGNENIPQGPGSSVCNSCDLFRLITSTCCGTGGTVENPITVGAGTALPRPMKLPPGFVPNQPITGDDGNTYPAGKPLPQPVTVPVGTIFPVPLDIPGGMPLSTSPNDGTGGSGGGGSDNDDGVNGTLYMTGDFWGGPPEVWCWYPCTILFPPITTTTTWTPPVFTFSTSGVTTTVTPTPETTQKIRVPKVTVSSPPGSDPTKTVQPQPVEKPLCITIHILFVTIKICPPPIPKIHLPPLPLVTIKPLPPGRKPGPTNKDNKPTDDEKEEEEEEDEDEQDEDSDTCPAVFINDDPDDTDVTNDDYPGEGADNTPPGYTPPAAGTGTASTTTISVTVTVTPPTSQPTATPTLGGTTACYDQSTPQSTALWHSHMFEFCHDFEGQVVEADVDADPSSSWLAFWYRWYDNSDDWWTWIGVNANPGCAFEITQSRCNAIMQAMVDKCGAHAGQYRDNCALWNAVPGSKAHGDIPGPVNGHRNPDALLNPPKGATTIGQGPDYPTPKPPVTVTVTQSPTTPSTPPPTSTAPSRVYNVWSVTFVYATGGGNSATIYRVQGYDRLVKETCNRNDAEWDYTQTNAGTDFYHELDNMKVFGDTCTFKASVTSYNGLSRGTKIGALTCKTLPGATCYRGAASSSTCDYATQEEEMYCVWL